MAAFGLHTLVSIEVLKGYDPSYVVFGKQCMQCVILGSLIVAGDVTVFGLSIHTSHFSFLSCRIPRFTNKTRFFSTNLLAHEFPGSLERGGVPHAEDTLSTRMRPLQLVRGVF